MRAPGREEERGESARPGDDARPGREEERGELGQLVG